MEFSFQHYLAAKRSVDDRSLNQHVWQQLRGLLSAWQTTRPIHVLEVGSGIGTMLQRLVEWGGLQRGTYLGIDADHASIETARQALPGWAAEQEYGVAHVTGGFELVKNETRLRAACSPLDVHQFLQAPTAVDFDLVAANAFLDLIEPAELLHGLGRITKPGGLGWFTINFDGLTLIKPEIDPDLDAKIISLYHCSMDERRINGQLTGGSQTGRSMFDLLAEAGWDLLAAGSSDWVVHPMSGEYLQDEAYFLQHILHFFEQTLSGSPELDPGVFQAWLTQRRAQAAAGQLVFMAHQLDFLARWPG